MMSPQIPGQSASHSRLLDSARRSRDLEFAAIVVPTNRRVDWLTACMEVARETRIPLVVVCSKLVRQRQAIKMAAEVGVKAYALDWPPYPTNPLGITFATSSDPELAAASSVRTRDLGMKRNLGLVLARILDWKQLMFLDDDIYGITGEDVDALAAGLNDHSVSVLIPNRFEDNPVVCHASRLGGGEQGTFASAGAMGVRCDLDDLAFFPNIYNEDWFFFSAEAANRKIIKVGESMQMEYDPYDDPDRAIKEEFGDLLAEGLYARLDHGQGLHRMDTAYWEAFIKNRSTFHANVADSLMRHAERDKDTKAGRDVRAAEVSVRAARDRLDWITPELCDKFIKLWQYDLVEWRRYLAKLDRVDSIGSAFRYLNLHYAESPSPRTL
jgi:glycosyltransferase involved in cell wall biosynthesis